MNNVFLLQNGLTKYYKEIIDSKEKEVIVTDKPLKAKLFFNRREATLIKRKLWNDYRKDFVIITI